MFNIFINEYIDLYSLLYFYKLIMFIDLIFILINRIFVLLFLKNFDILILDIFFKFYYILLVFLKVRIFFLRIIKESFIEKTLKKR